MEERHLNFNNFISQRASQIAKFTQILQVNTSKRTHQSLPKSIRRRAMSHNRYRIPFRMRRPMLQQLIKSETLQKIPKFRKNIRKSHRLLLSYKQRSAKSKWLSTHLWAAKRMRMCQHGGYKISESPNNKSFRSAYRHFRHNACLMDYSYLQCLTIRIKSTSNIPHYILPRHIRLKQYKVIKDFGKLYQGQLRTQQQDFICPIIIFPQSNKSLRCFFDPLCLQLVKQLLWKNNQLEQIQYQVEITKSKSEIYLLLGPEAICRAKQALQKLRLSDISQRLTSSSQMLMTNNNLIHLNCQKQQKFQISKPMISEQIKEVTVDTYNPKQNKRIRQMFFQSLTKHRQAKIEHPEAKIVNNQSFWSFYDNLSREQEKNSQACTQYVWKITSRSKYTHKRNNKLNKQQKKKFLIEQAQIRQNKLQKTPDRQAMVAQGQKIQQLIKSSRKEAQLSSIQCDPIIIAPFVNYNSLQNMYQGCFVLCSNQQNCILWRALSQTNVKVIGRKEMKICTFEANLRFFPDDFVQAKGFEQFNRARAIKLIDRQARQSKYKRINYMRIHSPFPFYYISPEDKTHIQFVSVSILSRGRCFPGSYICSLNQEDYQKITTSIDKQGVIKSIVCEQAEGTDQKYDLNYKQNYAEITNIISSQSEKNTKRKIIGFITSGGYRQSQCKEAGIGYIFGQHQSRVGQNLQKSQYALIRKVTSKYYYVATMKRL